MKILILIDDLMPGGTEITLLNRLKYRFSETEARIITLFGPGDLAPAFRDIGIRVECLQLNYANLLRSYSKVKTVIRDFQPDIAVCKRLAARALFPRFLKKYVPAVGMHWGNPIIKRKLKYYLLERLQLRYADLYYASSRAVAEILKATYHCHSTAIIPNSFDPEQLHPVKHRPRERIRLISVGNLRPEKNHLEQLNIAAALRQVGCDFVLNIIGEGPLRRELEAAIAARGLGAFVKLPGRKASVPDWLQTSDIFLFTSSSEGFGMAIIEAMACALPCIVYNLPVLKEIDAAGGSMKIVPQLAVKEAVRAILEYAANPAARQELGNQARQLVAEKFSARTIMPQLEKVFHDTITRQQKSEY